MEKQMMSRDDYRRIKAMSRQEMSDFFYNIDYVAEFYETMLDLSK